MTAPKKKTAAKKKAPAKAKAAKPKKPTNREVFIGGLREGMSVGKAASAANIARSTVYAQRKGDKSFGSEWDDAVEEGTDKLEDEAWRRAVEGDDVPVGFYEGVAGEHVKKYSDSLLILLLKARRRTKFGDKIETSTGENSMDELNAEDKEILARAGLSSGE